MHRRALEARERERWLCCSRWPSLLSSPEKRAIMTGYIWYVEWIGGDGEDITCKDDKYLNIVDHNECCCLVLE
jgi:hypothetical protein